MMSSKGIEVKAQMQGVMIDEHQKWEHKAELLNEEEKKQDGYTGQIRVIDLGRLGDTPQ